MLPAAVLLFGCQPHPDNSANENTINAQDEPEANDITGNYYLPPLAAPGTGAYLSSELLYPLDNKPTPECHSSTMVETAEGLVCAYFGGIKEGHPEVGIMVSRLVDGSWTWPVEVANGVQNDTLRYATWNPVLFQPKNGPLMLFYKVGPDPRSWWGMLITSTDGGRSWSKPLKLGEDEKIGDLVGPVKNKPIQMADGTILCPSSTETRVPNSHSTWKAHVELSTDNGKTWEVIGPIDEGNRYESIQPTILTYPDKSLQLLCRSRQSVISQSWSKDQGRTWSALTATALPNPNSGVDGVSLTDGRQLLVYNHSTREGEEPTDRNILNVALSEDGINWTPVMTLENKPAPSGYSYPAVIETSDGLVHITYTYMRRSIKHVVVDPKLL